MRPVIEVVTTEVRSGVVVVIQYGKSRSGISPQPIPGVTDVAEVSRVMLREERVVQTGGCHRRPVIRRTRLKRLTRMMSRGIPRVVLQEL